MADYRMPLIEMLRKATADGVPGRPQPMIEPDFRTFAEVECIDEAPLLDETALCAEVGQ